MKFSFPRFLLAASFFSFFLIPLSANAAPACGSYKNGTSQCFDSCPAGWDDVGGIGDGCGSQGCCFKLGDAAPIPSDPANTPQSTCEQKANGAAWECLTQCKPNQAPGDSSDCLAKSQLCCITPPATVAAPGTGPAATQGSSVKLEDPLGGVGIYGVLQRLISTVLGLVGGVALLAFVYAGILYMLGTNDKRVTEAKDIMVNATIGLVIIMGAYVFAAAFFRFVTT